MATGKLSTTNIDKVKLTKDTIIIGTCNVQTLWTTGKLELFRNEIKRFHYDIVGISEVRWTGKGETQNGDFIWSGEDDIHTRGVELLLCTKGKRYSSNTIQSTQEYYSYTQCNSIQTRNNKRICVKLLFRRGDRNNVLNRYWECTSKNIWKRHIQHNRRPEM